MLLYLNSVALAGAPLIQAAFEWEVWHLCHNLFNQLCVQQKGESRLWQTVNVWWTHLFFSQWSLMSIMTYMYKWSHSNPAPQQGQCIYLISAPLTREGENVQFSMKLKGKASQMCIYVWEWISTHIVSVSGHFTLQISLLVSSLKCIQCCYHCWLCQGVGMQSIMVQDKIKNLNKISRKAQQSIFYTGFN